MRIVIEMSVAQSADRVWSLLSDDNLRPLWMPEHVATTYPEGRPSGDPVGTRFRETLADGPSIRTFEGEIRAYVEGRLLAVALEDAMVAIEASYRLGRAPGGTLVRYAGDYHLKGIVGGGLLMTAGRPMIEARVRRDLERLKRAAEGLRVG